MGSNISKLLNLTSDGLFFLPLSLIVKGGGGLICIVHPILFVKTIEEVNFGIFLAW